jgi:hypothetical protein
MGEDAESVLTSTGISDADKKYKPVVSKLEEFFKVRKNTTVPSRKRTHYGMSALPHFWLNFLLRSNVYWNMRPCVAALEKCSSRGGSMRTDIQKIEVRSISNLPKSLVRLMSLFNTNERSCIAGDCNHTHLVRLPSTADSAGRPRS